MWSHRVDLARSVHDMAKQMYDNTKYSRPAWNPLSVWLFNCTEQVAVARRQVLTKFNKENNQFHSIIATCLWNLANGPNLPWGRGAVRPEVYSEIPIHEKVDGFFFVFVNLNDHIWAMSPCASWPNTHNVSF